MRTAKKDKIKRVLVALKLCVASGRDFLSGFSRYARDHYHWQLRILANPNDLTTDLLKAAVADRLDGLVMSESQDKEVAQLLESIHLPVTLLGHEGPWISKRKSNITYVRNNDTDIGRLAARHLLSLGRFRTLAFVPDQQDSYWAKDRARGFAEQATPATFKIEAFHRGAAVPPAQERERLAAWLKGLPKPAGIFAASDQYASEVIELCETIGIPVPQSISVIGVDNDQIICDFTNPPLTSILPDHEHMGMIAAKELSRLMNGTRPTAPRHIFNKEKRLIERESTRTVLPAAHLVDELIRYVRANAARGTTADDVIRHLGVSRRLADLRLKQLQDTTVSALIATARLEEVARWLRTSRAPCSKIAAACGYGNPKHLSNAFIRHFGMTMTDYRRHHGPEPRSPKAAR